MKTLTIETANELARADPEFIHAQPGTEDAEIIRLIDKTIGGWPSSAGCLMFFHGGESKERRMEFHAACDIRTGWWTSIMNAREYHLLKIGIKPMLFDHMLDGIPRELNAASRSLSAMFIKAEKAKP